MSNPIENLVIGIAILYFIPSIIALLRGRNFFSVFVINLFLGWSLVGWVVALAWSLSAKSDVSVVGIPQPAASIKQETDDHLREACPFCSERILKTAKVCRFCSRELPMQEVLATSDTSSSARESIGRATSSLFEAPKLSEFSRHPYAVGGIAVVLFIGIAFAYFHEQKLHIAQQQQADTFPSKEHALTRYVTQRGDEFGYIAASKSWPSDAKVLYVNFLGRKNGLYYMTFTMDDGHLVTESCSDPCKQANETQALNGKVDLRRMVHFSHGTPLSQAIQDMLDGVLAPSKYPNE